ncbi:MAG: hypothetical protein AB7I52_01940 [Rhizobiaceae bacterium]
MSRLLTSFRILLLAFAAMALSGLEAGATEFDVVGYGGTAQRPAVCKDGSALVGFRGRRGSWIDQMIPVCAPVLEGGRTGKQKGLGSFGGSGGNGHKASCDENDVITALEIITDSGARTLHGVIFTCTSLDGQNTYEGAFRGKKRTNLVGHPLQACPGGEVATGVNINYGADVNGLGLICGEVAVPGGEAEAPADTGNDPVEIRGFAGVWDIVPDDGDFVTLILQTSGADVSGSFGFSSAPGKDGTLRGTLQSRTEFVYTFQQNNGGAGSGIFNLSEDGNIIQGSFASNGVGVVWRGKRRP